MTHKGEPLSHLARRAIHTLPRMRGVASGFDGAIVTLLVPAIFTDVLSIRMICLVDGCIHSGKPFGWILRLGRMNMKAKSPVILVRFEAYLNV